MTDTGSRQDSPDLATDILRGAAAIADFVFNDPKERRRVYDLASEARGADKLPCFRLGATICARKSTLLTWIAELEAKSASQRRQSQRRGRSA
jgi:hypothetical protein